MAQAQACGECRPVTGRVVNKTRGALHRHRHVGMLISCRLVVNRARLNSLTVLSPVLWLCLLLYFSTRALSRHPQT